MEAFSLQNVVEMLEEVVVSWQEVRWNMADEPKRHSPICSTFEVFVLQPAARHFHGEELGPIC